MYYTYISFSTESYAFETHSVNLLANALLTTTTTRMKSSLATAFFLLGPEYGDCRLSTFCIWNPSAFANLVDRHHQIPFHSNLHEINIIEPLIVIGIRLIRFVLASEWHLNYMNSTSIFLINFRWTDKVEWICHCRVSEVCGWFIDKSRNAQ